MDHTSSGVKSLIGVPGLFLYVRSVIIRVAVTSSESLALSAVLVVFCGVPGHHFRAGFLFLVQYPCVHRYSVAPTLTLSHSRITRRGPSAITLLRPQQATPLAVLPGEPSVRVVRGDLLKYDFGIRTRIDASVSLFCWKSSLCWLSMGLCQYVRIALP